MPRGGRRPGAGRPRKPIEQHQRQHTQPHYPAKPKPAPEDARSRWPKRPFWIYPDYGLVLDPRQLVAVVDEVWNEDLEAAWPPEHYPYSASVMTPRQVAKAAIDDWAMQWWREEAPEWAASKGVPIEAIVETWGRAADPSVTDPFTPPTQEDVRELLLSGWLRRYWTYSLSADEINTCNT